MYVPGATNRPNVLVTNADFLSPCCLACICFSLVARLSRSFSFLQVEIPWLTRLLLRNYWRALPVFSFIATGLAVVRQVVSLNKAQRRATNAYLFLVAVVLPSAVVLALYMPILKLMWKARSLG